MGSSRMINGVDVQFPFDTPYPAQMMVASKVLTALQKRHNALIESPTGTGKSLALLCSVLAYQQSISPLSDDESSERKIPTVYYMSRTHSQLAQVVKELARTTYRPKMTILGSRDQLCIHKRPGVSADENCHDHLNNGTCEYYFNTYRLRSALERSEIFDIEDLVKSGTTLKACPYFTTRSLTRPPGQAKLILCPYNYVVDMAVRRSLGLDLKDAILIFDEAHNIESVARESASSTYQIPYLEVALNSLHDVEDSADLRSALRGLVEYIGQCAGSMTTISFEHDAHVESGQRMLDILSEFGLGPDSISSMRSSIQTLTARYRDDLEGFDEQSDGVRPGRQRVIDVDGVDPSRVMAALRLCETLCSTLELLYRENATQHYRLALTRKANDVGSGWDYSLSFWCLAPAVAIEDIAKASASIVVASGTLFPLGSFAAELGITFEQKVEAPHVISDDQVWVGVVPDVSNRHLTSTYNFVNTLDFQDQLALTLIGLASRIPAGMLVFLPSYSLLDRLLIRWKQTKQFAALNRTKTVIVEDRRSGADFDANVKKYRRLCGSKKGAIFFGVYRGKLSEGIDFANDDARAVVCIGIPYPNTKEAQVTLKQAHNTAMLRLNPNNPIPSGREWYSQQAYRALNQAVGRCIRHSQDYGAIIFIDARFQQHDVMSNVSKWVRKRSVVYQRFNEAVSDLDEFFHRMAGRLPLSSEPEWKESCPKSKIQTGAMDSFVKKWAVKKKAKLSPEPDDNSLGSHPTAVSLLQPDAILPRKKQTVDSYLQKWSAQRNSKTACESEQIAADFDFTESRVNSEPPAPLESIPPRKKQTVNSHLKKLSAQKNSKSSEEIITDFDLTEDCTPLDPPATLEAKSARKKLIVHNSKPAIVNIPILSGTTRPKGVLPSSYPYEGASTTTQPANAVQSENSTITEANSFQTSPTRISNVHPIGNVSVSAASSISSDGSSSVLSRSDSSHKPSLGSSNAGDFLNQFRYTGSSSHSIVTDVPSSDRNAPVRRPLTSTSNGPNLSCRNCKSVLWEDPGSYEVFNKDRNMFVAAQALLPEDSRAALLPMEGHNHINVVYDIPAPVSKSSIQVDNGKLYFNSDLGIVLRQLSCKHCGSILGAEIIAASKDELIRSHVGRSWILGAVIVVDVADRGPSDAVDPTALASIPALSNPNPRSRAEIFLESLRAERKVESASLPAISNDIYESGGNVQQLQRSPDVVMIPAETDHDTGPSRRQYGSDLPSFADSGRPVQNSFDNHGQGPASAIRSSSKENCDPHSMSSVKKDIVDRSLMSSAKEDNSDLLPMTIRPESKRPLLPEIQSGQWQCFKKPSFFKEPFKKSN